MDKFEHILDQALKKIASGSTLPEVLAMHPENREELEKILSGIMPLFSLPKKSIPEPSRQRKYMIAPQPKVWLAWLHVSKLAGISISVMLLVSTVTAAYATLTSLPGSTLFSLKKGTEKLQLTLAGSEEAKADLQIQIAQKRLNEAQLVLSLNKGDKTEKAAINELLEQTKNAIEVTNQLATTNSEPSKSQTAVNTLEEITKRQKTLLAKIKKENRDTDTTKQALAQTEENIDKLADIKRFIATASNDEALVDLDIIRITGTISKIDKQRLVIEETEVAFSDATLIKSGGLTVKFSDLKEKTQADIQAKKNKDEKLVALEINIKINKGSSGTVKGASNEAAGTEPNQASSSKKSLQETPAPTTGDETGLEKNPNTAAASVIFEDPSPTLK